MDELQKESNLKRYQYLPPRDRYRLLKQMKADEEAERIKYCSTALLTLYVTVSFTPVLSV